MKVIGIYSLLLLLLGVESAKILGIFPRPSKSHHILGNALLKQLAKRGHEVTMISPYPLENPEINYPNYHHIRLTKLMEKNEAAMKTNANKTKGFFENILWVLSKINDSRDILLDEALIGFLETNPKFDVTILLTGINEALLGIPHAINSSVIAFNHIGTSPFLNILTGNPNPVAYVPHLMLPYSDKMSFMERTINTLANILTDLYMNFYYIPMQEAVLKEFFPEAPSLYELIDTIDIVLANSHFTTETPRPYLPNIIQIGGFHLEDEETLTEDLEEFMNSSKNGVIYFSFGTNMNSKDLGENTIDELLSSFSKSKHDFLWKFEGVLKETPGNVKTLKWIPQKAVLKHPKTIAFITHGGLGSTVEAIYYGIPMICVPFVGDQIKNAVDSVDSGIAVKLEKHDLVEAKITEALEEITGNRSYANAVMMRSDLYRNQPVNPMEKAVFWVEHVAKYGSVKYLKSRANDLAWYQYMLIDVLAFISLVLLLMVIVIYYMIKLFFIYFCKDNKEIVKNKND